MDLYSIFKVCFSQVGSFISDQANSDQYNTRPLRLLLWLRIQVKLKLKEFKMSNP